MKTSPLVFLSLGVLASASTPASQSKARDVREQDPQHALTGRSGGLPVAGGTAVQVDSRARRFRRHRQAMHRISRRQRNSPNGNDSATDGLTDGLTDGDLSEAPRATRVAKRQVAAPTGTPAAGQPGQGNGSNTDTDGINSPNDLTDGNTTDDNQAAPPAAPAAPAKLTRKSVKSVQRRQQRNGAGSATDTDGVNSPNDLTDGNTTDDNQAAPPAAPAAPAKLARKSVNKARLQRRQQRNGAGSATDTDGINSATDGNTTDENRAVPPAQPAAKLARRAATRYRQARVQRRQQRNGAATDTDGVSDGVTDNDLSDAAPGRAAARYATRLARRMAREVSRRGNNSDGNQTDNDGNLTDNDGNLNDDDRRGGNRQPTPTVPITQPSTLAAPVTPVQDNNNNGGNNVTPTPIYSNVPGGSDGVAAMANAIDSSGAGYSRTASTGAVLVGMLAGAYALVF